MNKFSSQELQMDCNGKSKIFESSNAPMETSQKNINGHMRDKVFVTRNSLLTDFFENDHLKTILNIFIVILILLIINTIHCEYNGFANCSLGFNVFLSNFTKLDVVLVNWVGMQLASIILLFNGFVIWARNRQNQGKLWDYFWLSSYILYLVGFFYYPALTARTNNLQIAPGCILICEQVRLIMKSHGFLRTNVVKVLEQIKLKGGSPIKVPTFSNFLYYFFAPTLIYRDEYPRTSKIRWKFVVTNFCHLIASVYFMCILFTYFIKPKFDNFGKDDSLNLPKYIDALLNSALPSSLLSITLFYIILHCWMNALAEMLRFGDRQFYTDWWNSTSYATFYRTWNVVVHDYIYTYVYKDILHFSSNRVIATISVFVLSAIIHEYVVTVVLGFFFPVLLISFTASGITATLILQTKYKNGQQIFFWLTFILGTAMNYTLYYLEWSARQKCPAVSESSFDFLIPRMWVCYSM